MDMCQRRLKTDPLGGQYYTGANNARLAVENDALGAVSDRDTQEHQPSLSGQQ